MKVEIEKTNWGWVAGVILSFDGIKQKHIYLSNDEATELLYLLDKVLRKGKNGSSYPSYGNHNAE